MCLIVHRLSLGGVTPRLPLLAGGARLSPNSPGTVESTRESILAAWRCVSWKWQASVQDLPPSLAHVPHSAQPLTGRRATTAPVIWQEVRAYSPTPLGLSSAPGNPFWPRGDVFCGSSRREYHGSPLPHAQPSHSHACHSVARDFPELRVYCRGSPGSIAPGILFWRRCHAFRGSGRREYKAHRLL